MPTRKKRSGGKKGKDVLEYNSPNASVCKDLSAEDLIKRRETLLVTKRTPFLQHTDGHFWHGRVYRGPDQQPVCTWPCDDPPRDDHDCPAWLTASEFSEHPDVFQAKCAHLAQLMRSSKRTVLYTGAGISASVVGQAARTGANEQGWKEGGGRRAQPTRTHFFLAHLARAGFIDDWVQQNHDGLPQKAGFPQESINEVHGSWYDPSNPVVKYGGHLRNAEAKWMRDAANTADLVIVLGTSLGGLNADQVATNAAHRSLKGGSLGAVCINLQQTPEDGKMSLRLFGKSDDVLAQVCKILKDDLARNLGLQEGEGLSLRPRTWSETRVLVPYDANGHLVHGGAPWMWLDLGTGREVKIVRENNIQGCKQRDYRHIGAKTLTYNVERKDIVFSPGVNLCADITKTGLVAAVREGPAKEKGVQSQWIMRKIIDGGETKDFSPGLLREVVLNGSGDYTAVFDVPRECAPLTGTVLRRDDEQCCFDLAMSGATMHLGVWWLEAAARGALNILPLTNVNPEFASAPTVNSDSASEPTV